MTTSEKLGNQPNTKSTTYKTNVAGRAIMDLFGVDQRTAQGPRFTLLRKVLYAHV